MPHSRGGMKADKEKTSETRKKGTRSAMVRHKRIRFNTFSTVNDEMQGTLLTRNRMKPRMQCGGGLGKKDEVGCGLKRCEFSWMQEY